MPRILKYFPVLRVQHAPLSQKSFAKIKTSAAATSGGSLDIQLARFKVNHYD
jgi:hypothetical protein